MKKFIPVSLAALFGTACTASHQQHYPTEYAQSHSQDQQQTLTVPEQLYNLQALFENFKQDNLSELIDQTYAETFYFNDTLHTFRDREALKQYFLATADRVDETKVVFEDIAMSGDSYYVRWRMYVTVDLGYKNINSESIGMSQFKFDEQNQVILHQDFWDNTEGLFRHMPVVGPMINQIKKRL